MWLFIRFILVRVLPRQPSVWLNKTIQNKSRYLAMSIKSNQIGMRLGSAWNILFLGPLTGGYIYRPTYFIIYTDDIITYSSHKWNDVVIPCHIHAGLLTASVRCPLPWGCFPLCPVCYQTLRRVAVGRLTWHGDNQLPVVTN